MFYTVDSIVYSVEFNIEDKIEALPENTCP
jgi:hypothetical protein